MKIGCSTWSFRKRYEEGADNATVFKAMADAGMDGVEILEWQIVPQSRGSAEGTVRLAKECGLEVPCISPENDFCIADPQLRRVQIDRVRRWIEIASGLEIPVLRIFTGYEIEGHALEEQRAWVREALFEVSPYAAEYGVVLALENHSTIANSPQEVKDLIDAIGSPGFRCCLDANNFSDLDDGLELMYTGSELLLPLTAHSHVKFLKMDADGKDNKIDYTRLLPLYRKAGYDGWLSLELSTDEEPEMRSALAASYLRKVLESL